ncbi:MAG: TetR/AcrR family transcriptional regulator [Pseudomonadota bacterium]
MQETKAQRTRAQILSVAQHEASLVGIDALTLGGLAASCNLSKSGLNAHFGSKEALQIAVIDAIAERFRVEVAQPAFSVPPGLAQLDAIMVHWIAWSDHPDRPGGCQLIAASFDFDGMEGNVRNRLADWINAWRSVIADAVGRANGVDKTNLDPQQTSSLAYGLYMAQHVERLLLGDESASPRALTQWRRHIGHDDT